MDRLRLAEYRQRTSSTALTMEPLGAIRQIDRASRGPTAEDEAQAEAEVDR